MRIPPDVGLTAPVAPLVGHPAGDLLVRGDDEALSRIGHVGEAENLHRHGRAGRPDLLAVGVDQGPHPTPGGAGHQRIADLQRAALDEHRGHGAATDVQERLQHHALRPTVRIGPEVLDLCHHVQVVQEVVYTQVLQG